jgi:hypothetical protein
LLKRRIAGLRVEMQNADVYNLRNHA